VPKLVVNIGLMPRQLTFDKVEVVCSLKDEMRHSPHIGQEVLLAYQVVTDGPAMIFARATLTEFASQGADTVAVFTGPSILPDETEISGRFQAGPFELVADEDYPQPASGRLAYSAQEAGAFFTRSDLLGQIAAQVRLNARSVCSFSGVPVAFGEGMANPIRPLALGGQEHVRNFIYLHDEPAELFNRFAWTVGPNLEIVVDTYALTASVLPTVNPTGKLLVSEDPSERPDERALAWHREQFMQRLR
jgi:hypothetical protein